MRLLSFVEKQRVESAQAAEVPITYQRFAATGTLPRSERKMASFGQADRQMPQP